tara:strand:+ start:973 stop:1698 length:726 start_codon:yes stop_codon:yes gene_type:complete
MGKFLNKFKEKSKQGAEKVDGMLDRPINEHENLSGKFKNPDKDLMGDINDIEDEDDIDFPMSNNDWGDEVGVRPAQKPESFHHFILQNEYKDLERSIRGLKDVWDKQNQKWITKRKEKHCFTDEEAEDILRLAQSHLATDIKLGRIKKEVFGTYMNALYKEIAMLFESMAEYRYGRYGDSNIQYEMKLQNQKIFLELWTRIQANYSRSIEGEENKATHNSVKAQESLQSTTREEDKYGGYS